MEPNKNLRSPIVRNRLAARSVQRISLFQRSYQKVKITSYKKQENVNGFKETFGEFLAQLDTEVDKANWMKDPRFGGVDRKEQIINVLEKVFYDYKH